MATAPPMSAAPAGVFRVNLDQKTVIFLMIMAVAAFMRLWNLDYMALHHDESLYAKYAWNLYMEGNHFYDPMQHGPFMFHMAAWSMFLFGDTDITIRLVPVVLSLGVLVMTWLWRYNREFGSTAALLGVALFAFTPITLYFNRFFRHDTPFTFFMMGVPTAYILYQRSKWNGWLILMAASFAGMFCVKENAFVSAIIFLGYATVFAAHYLHHRRYKFKALFDLAAEHPFLSKWYMFVCLWGFWIVLFAYQHTRKKGILSTKEPQQITTAGYWYFFAMHLFFIGLCVAIWWIGTLYEQGKLSAGARFLNFPREFFADYRVFVWSYVAFGAFCTVMFTNGFRGSREKTALEGFIEGCGQWFVYWYHQHNIARIAGPYFYYVAHQVIYEPLTLLICIVGLCYVIGKRWQVAAITGSYALFAFLAYGAYHAGTQGSGLRGAIEGAFLKLDRNLFLIQDFLFTIGFVIVGIALVWACLDEKRPFKAFLIGWLVLAFVFYSYLQEKVPWLNIHILMPMHLFAALMLRQFFESGLPRAVKRGAFAVLIPLALYGIHSSNLLVFYNADNAVEQAVYVQTHPDVKTAVEEVHRVAAYTGLGKNLEIAVGGDPTWPMSWYLRDYQVWWADDFTKERPIIMTGWQNKDRYNRISDNYVGRRYQLRSWWIPPTNEWLTWANFPGGSNWENFKEYLLYREPWEPERMYGSADFVVFVHKSIQRSHTWEQMRRKGHAPWVMDQRWQAPPEDAWREVSQGPEPVRLDDSFRSASHAER